MKRCIAILLALLALALLTACGDKAVPSSQSGPSSGGGLVASPPPDSSKETPSSAPESWRNETVEALLRDFNSPPSSPALSLGKPSGLVLWYGSDDRAQVPIPSSGPGLDQPNGASLRGDATVIVCGPGDGSDTITVLSTVDRGQSWQSSGLEVREAGKYNYLIPAFRDRDNGVLVLCQRTNDNEPIYAEDTGLIFTTGDRGLTWSGPASLPVMETLAQVTATESAYCISGEIDSRPVILHSADGAGWDRLELPLDTDQYTRGYCRYAAFSGDTGFAVVTAYRADEKRRQLYFYSEDGGQSWAPYEV